MLQLIFDTLLKIKKHLTPLTAHIELTWVDSTLTLRNQTGHKNQSWTNGLAYFGKASKIKKRLVAQAAYT